MRSDLFLKSVRSRRQRIGGANAEFNTVGKARGFAGAREFSDWRVQRLGRNLNFSRDFRTLVRIVRKHFSSYFWILLVATG